MKAPVMRLSFQSRTVTRRKWKEKSWQTFIDQTLILCFCHYHQSLNLTLKIITALIEVQFLQKT